MSKLKYFYTPLEKATIVDRRHPREVTPPGLVELKNAIPSRSDGSITIRPDWFFTSDVVYGISGDLTLPGTSQLRDSVNSISGLFGSDQVVYFTRFIPYGLDEGYSDILCDTYEDGRVSLLDGESSVSGLGTSFLNRAYRGSIMRVLNTGTGYSGAPYLFTESPSDADEYYMTDLAGSEVSLHGDYIQSLSSFFNGTVGSLTNYQATIDDNDTLGFDALYVRLHGDGTTQESPADVVGDSSFWKFFSMGINISGSPNKFTASTGGGTNEYYLTKKAGTEPDFVPDASADSEGCPSYLRWEYYRSFFKDSVNRSYLSVSSFTLADQIDYGTVESLSDQEWGIGDADSLGFDTLYLRAGASDPDETAIPGTRVPLRIAAYKDISHGTGNYTWSVSNKTVGSSDKPVYYLQLSGGDPKIDTPSGLASDGSVRRRISLTRIDYYGNRGYGGWGYGDLPEDGLGYNTIYLLPTEDEYVPNLTIEIVANQYYSVSNYSWASSAGGTNEYYLVQQDGSELAADFNEPYSINSGLKGEWATKKVRGTIASLNDNEWGFGKHAGDSLTYDTIYYRSDDGDPDDIGLVIEAQYRFGIYCSPYKWVESSTSNEWYLVDNGGSDASIVEPAIVDVNEYSYSKGTLGSLSAEEWGYGDNDSLGFNTVYIYSTSDPNGSVGTGLNDETEPKKVVFRSVASDYNYYVVDRVVDNDNLIIYGEAEVSSGNVVPTFYYNHNPFRTNYKLNVQGYTSGLIYCSPSIDQSVNEEDISGPFFVGLEKGDWKYSGKLVRDPVAEVTGISDPLSETPTLASNKASYIQIWPTRAGDNLLNHSYLNLSYGMTGAEAWTAYNTSTVGPDEFSYLSMNGNTDGSDPFAFASIQASGSVYISGGTRVGEGTPGFAYSTDAYGLVWISKDDSAYTWADDEDYASTDYLGISAAANSSTLSRVVALFWRSSDDRVVVRYTDDQGDTWNDTSISGQTYITDGDEATHIEYLGGQFIITVANGFYYGDGTSFTKKAISGATEIKSISFDGRSEWAAIESPDNKVWYTKDLTGTWTSTDLPKTDSSTESPWILYDSVGERWVVNTAEEFMWTEDFEVDPVRETPLWASFPLSIAKKDASVLTPGNMIQDSSGIFWPVNDEGDYYQATRFSYYWWEIDKFVPISEDYRSQTFSVLDQYVVLIGVSEREVEEIKTDKTETLSPSPSIDGTEKDFTFTLGTLGDNGIVPESIRIVATLTDDTTETVTDDGDGTLSGDTSATGTINYETGSARLVFNDVTVKNGTSLEASYQYSVDGDVLGWTYYPRRIRWSAPKTYDDFSGVGSGTGDADGTGAFLDARPVNGRIVVFETNTISSIVPRGDVSDPWDFDTIQDNIKLMSNPVVVEDSCFFISSDGLLWKTDGINVMEVGASFDITKFDDFDELSSVSLRYSEKLNSLLAYYFNPNESSPHCYSISLSNGSVTKVGLPLMSDSDGLGEEPANVLCVEDSEDDRIFVSYHPLSSDSDSTILSALGEDRGILGIDRPVESGQDDYWYATIETGELFLTPEGQKTSLRHLIINSYTSAGDADNTYRPYVAVEIKSLEDSSWHRSGDSVGTATMTDAALTGSGTAWSNTIATPSGTGTQQECDGATKTFTLPCLGSQARVYLDSDLQTDYTTSGKTVTFTTAPAATKTLYAYWENYPEIKVAVGDVFKSTEGFHIITSIDSAQDITVDHYLSSGSETVTHYSTSEMPDGEGETKIGIKKLVEGVLVRLYVIPQYPNSANSSIVKISGLSIGHVPQGRKILEATGS